MIEKTDAGLLAGSRRITVVSRRAIVRARWPLTTLALGLLIGVWLGGGADRYGEADGILGSIRGAGRSLAQGGHYATATLLDLVFQQKSSVRNLGLTRQVETRLWQDKQLVADAIVVFVEAEGTVVLKGLVPDRDHKDRAVSLAQETRGVSRVVDQLAVAPAPRTIETTPSPAVPTGVASSDLIRK